MSLLNLRFESKSPLSLKKMIVTYYLQNVSQSKVLNRRQDTLVKDVRNEIILEVMAISNFRIGGL